MIAIARKCLTLLTPEEQRRWALLVPLVAIAAVLEAFGAAAVFALVTIIDEPGRAFVLPVASRAYFWLTPAEPRMVIGFTALLVALFYVVKNVFVVAVLTLQSRTVFDSIASLSQRMLRRYLAAPFAWLTRRNSAELIRNTLDAVDATVRLVIASLLNVLSEILVVAGILAVLLLSSPAVTLAAVIFLSALVALAIRLTRQALNRWGGRDQEIRKATLQNLQQLFGTLKEVRLAHRESFFAQVFARQQGALATVRHRFGLLSTALRFLVETVFVFGIVLVVLLATRGEGSNLDLLPLLGLYGYAGFRIIPSANRILMNLGQVRYGTGALEPLYNDFVALGPPPLSASASGTIPDLPFTAALEIEGVSYRYDGSSVAVLEDVRFAIRRGETVAIVGPTGAGKSTLINIILGLLQPTRGQILVDGKDIFTALAAWQARIGYVAQDVVVIDDSLRRNVAFGLDEREIEPARLQAALRMAQLDGWVASLPDGLDTPLGERGVRLSGGERQRVAIARALYRNPELLVFDEATSALDLKTERDLTRAVEGLHGKKTLIIIAHRLSIVRGADRVVYLRDGRVVDTGSFGELEARNAEFRALAAADRPPAQRD